MPDSGSSDTPPGSATSPADRDPLPLYRTLFAVTVSCLIAFPLMFTISAYPSMDNIEDVGESLVTGYLIFSESSETRGFVALVLAALVGGFGISLGLSRCPRPFVRLLGSVNMWLLPLFLIYVYLPYLDPGQLGALAFSVPAAMLLSQIVFYRAVNRERFDLIGLGLGLGLWSISYEGGAFVFLNISPVAVLGAGFLLVAAIVLRWARPELSERIFPWMAVISYVTLIVITFFHSGLIIGGVVVLYSLILVCGASPVVRDLMGICAAGFRTTPESRRPWYVCLTMTVVMIEVGFLLSTAVPGAYGLLLVLAQGFALGLLLWVAQVDHWIPGGLPKSPCIFEFLEWHYFLPVGVALVGIFGNGQAIWLSLCVMTATILLQSQTRFGRRSAGTMALVLAGLLAIGTVPDFRRVRGFDTFHDGQILNGVWEFEQGELLYSRVLPLRSTQFFLTLLSRTICPSTIQGNFFLEKFSDAACVAGACLAAYAWRRSPLWALVIGLMVQPGGEFAPINLFYKLPLLSSVTGFYAPSFGDPRDGATLLMTGLACELFRRKSKVWTFMLLGLPAFLGGYDIMAPYLAGIAVAIFCGSLDQSRGIRSVVRGALRAGGAVLASMVLFTVLLGILQSAQSAISYWQIFFDYCRHYSSFCGTKLNIDRFVETELLWLVIFTAAGAARWNQLCPRRRQMWTYLVVSGSLFWFRALGRSDFGHITGPLHLFHLMFGLSLLELILLIPRCGWFSFPHLTNTTGAALLLILIFAAGPTSNPYRLFQQYHAIVLNPADTALRHPPAIELVDKDSYLWAVDYGIANFLQRRHNPTRHGLAICISSPNEQRATIRDLRQRTPEMILWYWPNHDGVHGLTRHYILANYVLRHFRPAVSTEPVWDLPYATPADPDWSGSDQIPVEMSNTQSIKHLPRIWGEHRWPTLKNRLRSNFPIKNWSRPVRPDGTAPGWSMATDLNPRQINYLLLEFAATSQTGQPNKPPEGTQWTTVHLHFDHDQELGHPDETTWICSLDGLRYRYLIPIGCHPGWTWRTAIQRLQIRLDDGDVVDEIEARAVDIDEITE